VRWRRHSTTMKTNLSRKSDNGLSARRTFCRLAWPSPPTSTANRWIATALLPEMTSHLMGVCADFLHCMLQLVSRHAQYLAPPAHFCFVAKIYPVPIFRFIFGLFHRTSVHWIDAMSIAATPGTTLACSKYAARGQRNRSDLIVTQSYALSSWRARARRWLSL
jgi:hypothetical protein